MAEESEIEERRELAEKLIREAVGDFLDNIPEPIILERQDDHYALHVFLRHTGGISSFEVSLDDDDEMNEDIYELKELVRLAKIAEEKIKEIAGERAKSVSLKQAVFEDWYYTVDLDNGKQEMIILDEDGQVANDLKRLEDAIKPKKRPVARDLMKDVLTVLDKAKEESMKTGGDVMLTVGKIRLYLGCGINHAAFVSETLHDYLGLRPSQRIILKHDFLAKYHGEAQQSRGLKTGASS